MRFLHKLFTLLALLSFVPVAFVGCGSGADNSAPPTEAEMAAEMAESEEDEAAEEEEAAKQDAADNDSGDDDDE